MVAEPLGIAGFALALVFVVAGRVAVQKRRADTQWIVPTAYVLAAVCVLGGFSLAYRRADLALPAGQPAAAAAPSIHIDKIDQTVTSGAAVAGVQGDVTVNAARPQEESSPKR